MKYVLTWTNRLRGSAAENVVAAETTLKLLANWQPNPDVTIHQWVIRCDGSGGFSVLETENAAALYKDLAVWSTLLDFQLFPVLDIGDATPLLGEATDIARSVV